MGHQVRLIATKFVRPFVKTNKTDAADAAAIWEAAQRPGMRFVPVKTEQRRGVLALHNMRDLLVKSRTPRIHRICAVFYEYGIDLPSGRLKRHHRSAEFFEFLLTLSIALYRKTLTAT